MVNKLSTIRNKRDRADETYSESLRKTVKQLREENPMWTLQTIANAVGGLSRQRISQLLKSQGLPTVAVKELSVIQLTCDAPECGVTFERTVSLHRSNMGRGVRSTYCSGSCQREGIGLWQKQRGMERTSCKSGHEYTPDNIYLVPITNSSGVTRQARRCLQCRKYYAKKYYDQKRQNLQLQNLLDEGTTSDNVSTE